MALSTVIKNSFDGQVGTYVIADGTGTPLTAATRYEQGDFALSGGMESEARNHTVYQAAGKYTSIRYTDRKPLQITFTEHMAEFGESTTGTPLEMICAQAPHAARVSTKAAYGDVPLFNLTWTVEGTDLGDSADHTLECTHCHVMVDVSQGDPNTKSYSITCYGDVKVNGTTYVTGAWHT